MFRRYLEGLKQLMTATTRLKLLETELDFLRSKLEVSEALIEEFRTAKRTPDYQAVYKKSEPLVTICIGTYNRAELVVERSVKSALSQTYRNIEVIIVGDHCTDDTENLLSNIDDRRLTFLNLKERGDYPVDPSLRWMVAGTTPFNKALTLAKGDFITHLDDDDEYLPDRVEKLVQFIQFSKADIVYHPFFQQLVSGAWRINKSGEFRKFQVTTSSIFYHCWLKRIPWDINAYKYHEPGDWNRLRKILYIGADTAYFPEPLLKHFKERNQKS